VKLTKMEWFVIAAFAYALTVNTLAAVFVPRPANVGDLEQAMRKVYATGYQDGIAASQRQKAGAK
jgi:hypothetical protein